MPIDQIVDTWVDEIELSQEDIDLLLQDDSDIEPEVWILFPEYW